MLKTNLYAHVYEKKVRVYQHKNDSEYIFEH